MKGTTGGNPRKGPSIDPNRPSSGENVLARNLFSFRQTFEGFRRFCALPVWWMRTQVRLPMENAERLVSKAYEWVDQAAHELSWDDTYTTTRKGTMKERSIYRCVLGRNRDDAPRLELRREAL